MRHTYGKHIQRRHNIGDEIDTLLLGPTTDEHKQVSIWILPDTCPFLCLSLQLGPLCLSLLIDLDVSNSNRILIQGSNVRRIRVRQRVDVFKRPQSRVPRPTALSVLV